MPSGLQHEIPYMLRRGSASFGDVGSIRNMLLFETYSVQTSSGGVTPAQQFRVCTFGVAKLCMAWRGRNTHANDLHAAWFPTKGGRPEPIDRHVINNALMYAWGVPDVITDARCFRPPPHDWTDMHMGYSLTMSQRLVEDVDAFQPMWQKAMKQIPESAGGVTPVNIAVFCRAGEKRSVSIAWMLSASLQKHLGWEEAEPIDHLCRIFWGRRTCAGMNCTECDLTDKPHQDMIVKMARYNCTDGDLTDKPHQDMIVKPG